MEEPRTEVQPFCDERKLQHTKEHTGPHLHPVTSLVGIPVCSTSSFHCSHNVRASLLREEVQLDMEP